MARFRVLKTESTEYQTIVEAASAEEAKTIAEDLDDNEWTLSPGADSQDIWSAEVLEEDRKIPQCPKCNNTSFYENQIISESQTVYWNKEEGRLDYGSSTFNEIISVEDIRCNRCNAFLGADFFAPWHGDKTRSEIYGKEDTDD